MHYSFFIRILYFILITLTSTNSFAVEEKNKNTPQAYINLAKSKQDTDINAASKALKQAYDLAIKQNNIPLAAKALLKQVQIAKTKKNYYLAEQHLNKADALIPLLRDNELSVRILTNMSIIKRYLQYYDESMVYVERALNIAHESRDDNLIFKSLQAKGALLQKSKRYDSSVATYLSALRYTANVPYSDKVRLLRDIANAYNKVDEYQSGIRYYNKVIKVLSDNNDLKAMPITLIELAKTQAKVGNFTSAIVNINHSIALTRLYKDETNLLKSLVVLSIFYRKISSYEDALFYGLEALEIYQKKNDLNGIAAASNSVGLIYTHLNQLKNAKSYFTDVVSISPEKIKLKYRAAALRDLGKITFNELKNNEGLELSNEALVLYKKTGDRQGIATVQKNIGYIYHEMGDLPKSINAYNEAITFFQKKGDVWNEAETKAQLALITTETNINEAVKLAKNSLALANKIGAKSIAEKAYSALILGEEKQNNYQQALAYAKKKEALIGEIKADSIHKHLAEIHIILDVEKKERALEALTREKAVISLKLDNKEKELNLLEKEKTIKDLQTQNTFIILSVTMVSIVLGLFFIGRLYFNMQYPFIVCAVIIVSLLLYSFNANSSDIIKMTQGHSSLDIRPKYTLAVLNKALELSSKQYGPYEIQAIHQALPKDEKIMEVRDGKYINLTMAMTSPDWEYLALPIRIPIRRGVGSYRLLAINKANREAFKNIKTLKQLQRLTVGLKRGWVLNELLEEDFNIVEGLTYDGMFRMLNKNRFDYIPRGIHEAYDEISLRKEQLKNIMIEPNIALYIPQPYYIFVSPKHPRIAERIEYGLEKMIAQGLLQKMFDEHYSEFIKKANLSNRTIINIGNKYLTKKTPLDRRALWMMFDSEIKSINPY